MRLARLTLIALALTLAMNSARSQERSGVVRTDIPVSELNADLLFTCGIPGLPTVTLYYVRDDANQRDISYWQGRTPEVAFVLRDAVTSVVKEEEESETRWIIQSDGMATRAEGIAEGAPVSASLVIRQRSPGGLTMDFDINAEGFSRVEKECPRGPAIDRRPKVSS